MYLASMDGFCTLCTKLNIVIMYANVFVLVITGVISGCFLLVALFLYSGFHIIMCNLLNQRNVIHNGYNNINTTVFAAHENNFKNC